MVLHVEGETYLIFFEDLPYPIINRRQMDATFLRDLNNSFSNIEWSNEDYYYILIEGIKTNIRNMSFKDFYWLQMKIDIPIQPFKSRWALVLPNNVFGWNYIWENVHSKVLSYKTQSSLWMMTNLNFISAYTLSRMYSLPNICCKCNNAEEGYAHCFLFCPISNLVYMHFDGILRQFHDVDLEIEEKAFGIPLKNTNKLGKQLRNYFVACVKCVLFRNRARDCNGNNEIKSKILIAKCKKYITTDLEIKFLNYRAKSKLTTFRKTFLINNILGTITSNNNSINFTCNI